MSKFTNDELFELSSITFTKGDMVIEEVDEEFVGDECWVEYLNKDFKGEVSIEDFLYPNIVIEFPGNRFLEGEYPTKGKEPVPEDTLRISVEPVEGKCTTFNLEVNKFENIEEIKNEVVKLVEELL